MRFSLKGIVVVIKICQRQQCNQQRCALSAGVYGMRRVVHVLFQMKKGDSAQSGSEWRVNIITLNANTQISNLPNKFLFID